jgi:hypothetical protein
MEQIRVEETDVNRLLGLVTHTPAESVVAAVAVSPIGPPPTSGKTVKAAGQEKLKQLEDLRAQ